MLLQPPVLLHERGKWKALHIVCDYVLVLLLLAAAAVMQWRLMQRVLDMVAGTGDGDVEVGVTLQAPPHLPCRQPPPPPSQQQEHQHQQQEDAQQPVVVVVQAGGDGAPSAAAAAAATGK